MAQLIVFVVMLVAMYAVLIVPQQRKMKAQRALLASVEAGDPVLTASGIYGIVTEIDGNDVYLEVAQGIELKITKSSIATKLSPTIADEDENSDAKGK